jgi:hypothetical protein
MTLLCALRYVLYNLKCYGKAPQAENIQLYSAYAICHTQLCALGPPPIFRVMSRLQVCAFEVTVMRDRTLDRKTTVRMNVAWSNGSVKFRRNRIQ